MNELWPTSTEMFIWWSGRKQEFAGEMSWRIAPVMTTTCNRKDPLRPAPGGSFRLAVGIGLRLSTLVASANQLDSISSDASIRAEALSLSHLTWVTTVTIRFHIFWITLLSSVRRQ